jgi:hypothetical protein
MFASGHPVPLVRSRLPRLSLLLCSVNSDLFATVSSLCTLLFIMARVTGEGYREWLLKHGWILAGSLFMVALSLDSRSFTWIPHRLRSSFWFFLLSSSNSHVNFLSLSSFFPRISSTISKLFLP